jgi:hypothetical protein
MMLILNIMQKRLVKGLLLLMRMQMLLILVPVPEDDLENLADLGDLDDLLRAGAMQSIGEGVSLSFLDRN